MRRSRVRRLWRSAAVGVLLAVAALLLPTATADTTSTRDDVGSVFTDQLEAAGVSGGAYVIVTADGAITARGAGTTGDGDPVTADTPFVIGSTTKSFTALAVMQLVEAGKVDLDAPVTRYVPQLRLADGEPVEDITVRHLLQHTSGLDDLTGGPVIASARAGSALDAVAELRSARLASAPGRSWRYANANYVLAGLVVESASGQTYADYVQQSVLDPLAMTHTHLTANPEIAPGHQYWFGLPVTSGPVQRTGIVAAGYLASTATDLGRYLAMFLRHGRALDGTRVVSAEGVRTLTAPGPDAHLGAWADGARARYAMGWMVGGPWTQPAVFHPGNSPDSSAMIALFPERGLAAATLVPASQETPLPGIPSLPDRISRNTLHAVLGEPVPAPTTRWSFYVVFDLVAVGQVALGAWLLVRAAKARRHPSAGPVRRWLQPLPPLLTFTTLALLPSLLGYSWVGLATWAPDVSLLLALLTVLAGLTAAVRTVTALAPAITAPRWPRRETTRQAEHRPFGAQATP